MVELTLATLISGATVAGTNATAAKATTALTTKLSQDVLSKVLGGKGNRQLKQKIKAAIHQRMLVPADNFEPLRRDVYVSTPILASMRACPRTLGVIYVAYVPPGKGKSMACFAFLKKYAQGKAIAFSPPDGELTYVDKILGQLKLDVGTSGLVNELVEELNDGANKSKPSYIIFDDFMPDGPNYHDVQLLMELKSQLRGKNVYCIVLTSNVDSANYALSRNKLFSIQPLTDHDEFEKIFRPVDVKKITSDFTIDWEKHCSMMWDDAVMKQAILLLPEYAKLLPDEKATVGNAIDDYLATYEFNEDPRYHLTIYAVLSKIQEQANVPPTPAHEQNTAATPRGPDPGCCFGCFRSPLASRRGFFQ